MHNCIIEEATSVKLHEVERDRDRLSVVVYRVDREKHSTTSAGVVASINLIGRTRSRAVHNFTTLAVTDSDSCRYNARPTHRKLECD